MVVDRPLEAGHDVVADHPAEEGAAIELPAHDRPGCDRGREEQQGEPAGAVPGRRGRGQRVHREQRREMPERRRAFEQRRRGGERAGPGDQPRRIAGGPHRDRGQRHRQGHRRVGVGGAAGMDVEEAVGRRQHQRRQQRHAIAERAAAPPQRGRDGEPGAEHRRQPQRHQSDAERLERGDDQPDVQRRFRVVVVGRALEGGDGPAAVLEHLERAGRKQRLVPHVDHLAVEAKGEVERRQQQDGRRPPGVAAAGEITAGDGVHAPS